MRSGDGRGEDERTNRTASQPFPLPFLHEGLQDRPKNSIALSASLRDVCARERHRATRDLGARSAGISETLDSRARARGRVGAAPTRYAARATRRRVSAPSGRAFS
jgi:hypothetical protein